MSSDLGEQFFKLYRKFDVQTNCNAVELNHLLNDMNSICCLRHAMINETYAFRVADSIPKIPVNEDTLVTKACCLLFSLIKTQNIRLPDETTKTVFEWLIKCLEEKNGANICDVLKTMRAILSKANKKMISMDKLIGVDGYLIQLLKGNFVKNSNSKIEKCSKEEIILYTTLCLEAVLEESKSEGDTIFFPKYSSSIGPAIIVAMYKSDSEKFGETACCTFITSSLNICKKIIESDKDFAEERIGEILGVAKAFMMRGIPSAPEYKPTALKVSQQSILEPQDILSKRGAKTVKKRKRKIGKSNSSKSKYDPNPDYAQIDRNVPIYSVNRFEISESEEVVQSTHTSGSDFSESEGKHMDDRFKQTKLRLSCLSLIEQLAKIIDKKTMFGYWHSLFPVDENSSILSLPHSVLCDPSPRCRIIALQTISLIVRYSKFYLYQAESERTTACSFTPFAVTLGDMITMIYKILTKALSKEMHIPVVIQILKCFASLIQATPFHRLEPGLVTMFIKYIRRLIYHKDWDVKVTSFVVIGFLLSVTDTTNEIKQCLGIQLIKAPSSLLTSQENEISFEGDCEEEETDDVSHEEAKGIIPEKEFKELEIFPKHEKNDSINIEKESPENQFEHDQPSSLAPNASWILRAVLEILGLKVSDLKSGPLPNAPTPLKLECLHILSAMCSHFVLLRGNLNLIAEAIERSLNDPYDKCQLFAIRAIDFIGHAINQNLETLPPNTELFVSDLKEGISFWFYLYPILRSRMVEFDVTARALSCDVISSIGKVIYGNLTKDQRNDVIIILHIYCNDEDDVMRTAALRSMSILATYPPSKTDSDFVLLITDYILSYIPDPNPTNTIRLSWALGNMYEALVEVQVADPVATFANRLRDEHLEKSFKYCLSMAKDQEKIRYNIMRCIGNLIRLLGPRHLQEMRWQIFAMESVQAVVDNALNYKAVKVKWNACYSLGNMMNSEHIFNLKDTDFNWQKSVFLALGQLVTSSPNFKVRTTAAQAMANPVKRIYYDVYFNQVWKALLKGTEEALNLNDFNEYKHRDKLVDQLCISLAHFIKLAENQDIGQMQSDLLPHVDTTKSVWFRVVNRILPEQAAPLIEAAMKVKDLKDAKVLQSCFTAPIEY